MLTPLDVQKRTFKIGLRGYNEEEVNEYMELIANTLEKHINENMMLKEKLDRRDEDVKKYKTLESTMSETLVIAKKASEDLLKNATDQSENIIKDANLKAREIIENAERSLEDVNLKKQLLEAELESFKTRMATMLRAQIEIVNKYDVDLK